MLVSWETSTFVQYVKAQRMLRKKEGVIPLGGKKKRRIGLLLCLLFALCCAAGCGSKEEAGETEAAGTDLTGMESADLAEEGEYDYFSGSWTKAGDMTESAEPWGRADYWGGYMLGEPEADMQGSHLFTVLDGTDYYILERYTAWGNTGKGAQKYYLTRLDVSSMKAEKKEFFWTGAAPGSAEELQKLAEELSRDLEENWLILTGMEVLDGKLTLLALQMDRESKMPAHYYLLWLDAEGKVERAADLLQEMEQAGMIEETLMPEGLIYDRAGHYYIGAENVLSKVGVFDRDGKFLECVEAPDGGGGFLFHTCRLPDGRPVFECTESKTGHTILFCFEESEGKFSKKVLFKGECDSTDVRYLSDSGKILYPGSRGIMRWNVRTGEYERIYRDASLGSYDYKDIWETEEGGVVTAFYDHVDRSMCLQKLLPGAEEETVVTLLRLHEDSYIEIWADEYSRRHPGTKIEIVSLDPGEDYDAAFARFAVQLAEGEGPDMFLAGRKDLEFLQDKGVLRELSDFLPEELKEQVFPSVLQCGVIEEKLYGIGYECGVSTLAVSQKAYQEKTWDLEDILSLMETGDFQNVLGDLTSGKLLEYLVITGINEGKSSLVDSESGECRFDGEEFVKMLELCRRYGRESGKDLSGASLACSVGGNLYSFSQYMAELGEDYQCVGYPVNSGFGGYVECGLCLAVNAETKNSETARDFLQFLLSDRLQRDIGGRTVRKDILCGSVKEHTQFSSDPVFLLGRGNYMELPGKPDGSSFLPEYLEILENGILRSEWNENIGGVILEEAEAYFCGDKTAEEAAKVIQSRIQLYMDERK